MVRGHHEAFDGHVLEKSHENSQQLTSNKNVEHVRDTFIPEPPKYPSGIKLTFFFVALCLTVFLVALDHTIIATAIPTITSQFLSDEDMGWYGSAFLLTTCSFQLFFGELYTLLSLKWTFIGAVLIFEVGSAICGARPNSVAFIIGRAIAGIGGAGFLGKAIAGSYGHLCCWKSTLACAAFTRC
ncbi:hypothetical protein N7450_004681 [Penicillium hetheringtonii]|uniref:Major facilitator superfamily (MFS) profile domain-containing protein n=1 Tax=Penicillium hetheringtonii TaxID=911720 RepID=A0AAD6DRY2_9EURO|nr:hypothetical protein N7450_004681 [Penicillium hetheringtonii]